MPRRKAAESDGLPQRPRYRVDSVMASMSPEQRTEFMEFCRRTRSGADVQHWLRDHCGTYIPMSDIQLWRTATFPVGKEAEYFNLKTEDAQGIDPYKAQEWLLSRMAKLLSDVYTRVFQDAAIEHLEPQELLTMVTNLNTQMKALATIMDNDRIVRTKQELELAGAYRMAELLKNYSHGTQVSEAIATMTKAALEHIESEIKSAAPTAV